MAFEREYDVDECVAEHVTQAVVSGEAQNVMLALGRSPLNAYQALAERRDDGRFPTKQLNVIQLDGYWDLAPDDHRSLGRWLDSVVLKPWEIDDDQVVRLDETGSDEASVCRGYEDQVSSLGGLDLAVLGIGPNGHLGFNEPLSYPSSPTRVVELTAASIRSNAAYWGGEDNVPRLAITAGLGLILGARAIIVVVKGVHKRDILRRTVRDRPSPEVPSSYLQLHENTVVVANTEAWPDNG